MARSLPVVDATPDVKLAASNCERLVLDTYAVALRYSRDENKAFTVAVLAWRQYKRSIPPDDAVHEVATIIRNKNPVLIIWSKDAGHETAKLQA